MAISPQGKPMQSEAKTVEQYLAELPADRRVMLEDVRKMILANINEGFEEGMQYGMIGYYVPHSIFPAGYHCKPSEPLPFLSLASQKNYCSLYAMSLYSDTESLTAFQSAWKATGKKLNMGKSCIRFKKLDDLALDLIADHLRGITVDAYVDSYIQAIKK
ncbi:DUF1801 domain-containing protein [Rhodopirellula baltica]|uniref:YdhG-like domain-containing protein n=3 Tax=Rhodopirellula baltica TaxID=265606 RepID=Q7UGH8_RHOBA|nr:DUF1801 domain-containing protein [Rhodopirellula baltica]CAD78351.1 hypothetical protein RB5211 [Rhodopirellula baltica SH 1]